MLESTKTKEIKDDRVPILNPSSLKSLLDSSYGSPFLNHSNFRIVGPRAERIKEKSTSIKDKNYFRLFSQRSNEFEDYDIPGSSTNHLDLDYINSLIPDLAENEALSLSSKSGLYDLIYKSDQIGRQNLDDPFRRESMSSNRRMLDRVNSYDRIKSKNYESIDFDCSLPYEIYSWSSFSANYFPHNIISCKPNEQESRWSTSANNNRQFITLRLERPAFIRSIKFGKYFKRLRNDDKEEIITIKQHINGTYLPSQYIKIQPLVAYDQKFNYSIWHVQLIGTLDPTIVDYIVNEYNDFVTKITIKKSLKYFRENMLLSVHNELQDSTGISFSLPVLNGIYKKLISGSDYEDIESLVFSAYSGEILKDSSLNIPCTSSWVPVHYSCNTNEVPIGRGGHQMCIDDNQGKIYVFGGWDGMRNLSDLWEFDIVENAWNCICPNTYKVGGPDPRSLHSMCINTVKNQLYVLGKFIDHEYRDTSTFDSDFYCYNIDYKSWELISHDTASDGGPRLLYDSQMVFDPIYQRIYVYGGKILSQNSAESGATFGGLYCFETFTRKWVQLRPDFKIHDHEFQLQARIFHSMTIDPEYQRLYILSGQKDIKNLGDFLVYDIQSNTFFEKTKDLSLKPSSDTTFKNHLFQQRGSRFCQTNQFISSNSALQEVSYNNSNIDMRCEDLSNRSLVQWYIKNGYHIPSDFYDSQNISVLKKNLLENINNYRDTNIGISGGIGHSVRSIRATFDSKKKEIHVVTGHFYNNTVSNQPMSSIEMDIVSEEVIPSINSNFIFGSNDLTNINLSNNTTNKSGCDQPLINSDRVNENFEDKFASSDSGVLMTVLTYSLDKDEWTENYNSSYESSQCSHNGSNNFSNTLSQNIFASNATSHEKNLKNPNILSSLLKQHECNDKYPYSLKNDIPNIHIGFDKSFKGHPLPRYAMTVVYSERLSTHFMFGGNPNNDDNKNTTGETFEGSSESRSKNNSRLNDFWQMKLLRPSQSALLREALYLIRSTKFKELSIASNLDNPKFYNNFRQATSHTGFSKNENIAKCDVKQSFIQINSGSFKAGGTGFEVSTLNNEKILQESTSLKKNYVSSLSEPSRSNNLPTATGPNVITPGPFSEPRSRKAYSKITGSFGEDVQDDHSLVTDVVNKTVSHSDCLNYLHTMIMPLVDFECEFESNRYKDLAAYLFTYNEFEVQFDYAQRQKVAKVDFVADHLTNFTRKNSVNNFVNAGENKKVHLRIDLFNELEKLLCPNEQLDEQLFSNL
ncbi:Muskelin [Smittium culicis]|uniref:Muskelin n=1 Tax=Smittium culicis TaxID=133412 RepID=A0A1R1YCF3_9FUNG|nr:Muskelin [Smittium culicis]